MKTCKIVIEVNLATDGEHAEREHARSDLVEKALEEKGLDGAAFAAPVGR